MSLHIEVPEHGRVPLEADLAENVPPAFWASADCEVLRSPSDGWVLRAGNSVGIARAHLTLGEVILQVHPKLSHADPFFLADYAYGQRHEPLRLLSDDVSVQAVLRDPTACLLVWHARAIRRFAARWLRRDYESNVRVLSGKVKGRILIDRYITNHVAVGDAASVPCRIRERTQDTANNRVLKAGLRYIASVSGSLPVLAARRAVLREANAGLPLFAQVTDIRVSAGAVRATSTRGPHRHYVGVLAATLGLLNGRLMSDAVGSSQTTSSFMWRMPILFQEAVRGMIDTAAGLNLVDEPPGTARIVDASGRRRLTSKVDPDLVLRVGKHRTLLVDTKYKDALPTVGHPGNDELTIGSRHRIKVSRSDIYQAVAYREHSNWEGSAAALLYPVVLRAGEALPAPLSVQGFGSEVAVMFVDIGQNASANLFAFLETLRAFAAAVAAA